MPEQKDATEEIFGTGRGRTLVDTAKKKTNRAIQKVRLRNYIPPYEIKNTYVEATFAALGWKRKTVERLWVAFCRIRQAPNNKTFDGEITKDAFIQYFRADFQQSHSYIDRCFQYFDTTGSGTIDFLEFAIAVWNICSMEVDALSNFAFDLYDVDIPHGELSFPDIERMMIELFGEDGIKYGTGKAAMDGITLYAEERGGRLKPADFTIYAYRHQMILFPIFTIQKAIQRRVMGNRFWKRVERKRPKSKTDGLDPKEVQVLLRTHRTNAPAVLLGRAGVEFGVGGGGGLVEPPSKWAIIRQSLRGGRRGTRTRSSTSVVAAVDAFVLSGKRATRIAADKINGIGGVRLDPAG